MQRELAIVTEASTGIGQASAKACIRPDFAYSAPPGGLPLSATGSR
jgi:hypothetical protein